MKRRAAPISFRLPILMAVAAGIAVFYFIFDPVKWGWMPQCVFHKLTGLQCMGCGAQRMAHALLHGDIRGAWEANSFLLISLPFIFFLLFLEIKRSKYPTLYRKVHSQWVIITVSAILFLWLILRNIIGC